MAWLVWAAGFCAVPVSGQALDPATGLVVAPGLAVVKAHCTVCHSAKLVAQMRGDRSDWESLIRWMQQTQNLWPLPPLTESTILDYLASNYPPSQARSRRAPLAAHLLPPQWPEESSTPSNR